MVRVTGTTLNSAVHDFFPDENKYEIPGWLLHSNQDESITYIYYFIYFVLIDRP